MPQIEHWSDTLLAMIEGKPADGGARFERGTIVVKRHKPDIETPEAACQILRDWLQAGATGWLCLTSEVVVLLSPSAVVPANGIPLWAELARAEPDDGQGGHSLHLRQVGAKWVATEITRLPAVDGDTHLIFEHKLRRIDPPRVDDSGHLAYELAWKEDAEGIWRPWVARFTGIFSGREAIGREI